MAFFKLKNAKLSSFKKDLIFIKKKDKTKKTFRYPSKPNKKEISALRFNLKINYAQYEMCVLSHLPN